MRGYREEPGYRPDSRTPTFVAARLAVANWRWAGVPFYVRTGKRLPRRVTEICVQFRQPPLRLFGRSCDVLEPNVIVLTIQPEEGIRLRFGVKNPGSANQIAPVTVRFSYHEAFTGFAAEPYGKLLLDCLRGDLTLFERQDGVEAMWDVVDPLVARWEAAGASGLPQLPGRHLGAGGRGRAAGTRGAALADRVVVLFTRFPEPGRAKTRLIPRLGAEGACALQRAMTERTLRRVTARAAPGRRAPQAAAGVIEIRHEGGDAAAMRAWLGDGARAGAAGPGRPRGAAARGVRGGLRRGSRGGRRHRVGLPGARRRGRRGRFRWRWSARTPSSARRATAATGSWGCGAGARPAAARLFEGIPWGGDGVLAASRCGRGGRRPRGGAAAHARRRRPPRGPRPLGARAQRRRRAATDLGGDSGAGRDFTDRRSRRAGAQRGGGRGSRGRRRQRGRDAARRPPRAGPA